MFDLVSAIGAGMVITVVLFMKMVSEETEVRGWKYYCDESGVRLIFSHVNSRPMKTMGRAGFVELIGKESFRVNIDDAIAHATELIEAEEARGEEPVKA